MKYRLKLGLVFLSLLSHSAWGQDTYAPDEPAFTEPATMTAPPDQPFMPTEPEPPAIDVIALYTMNGVAVDVTAASAAAAREQAIFDGQRTALTQLMEKLEASKGLDATKLSDNKIAALVRSFEITSEKASAVRYIATMNVRFKPRSVASLLRSAGIRFLSTPQPPIVLLPLSLSEGKPVLWGVATPWRQAVEALAKPDGLQPVIVPKGNENDVQLIDAVAAKTGDAGALGAVATNYRAATVWVAYALNDPATIKPKQKLKVLVKRYDAYGQKQDEQTLTISPPVPISSAPIAAAATASKAAVTPATVPANMVNPVPDPILAQWQEAAKQLQNAVRRAVTPPPAAASSSPSFSNDNVPTLTTPAIAENNAIQLYAPLESLPELTRLKQRLSAISMISSVNVQTVRRDGADIGLAFVGTVEQLQQAAAAQGLAIQQNTAGLWQIISPQ